MWTERRWPSRRLWRSRRCTRWRRWRFAADDERDTGIRANLMWSKQEIERRFKNIRAAMAEERVDGLIVCGNQYSGFEGAVRYVSNFEIVHRYACVLIP